MLMLTAGLIVLLIVIAGVAALVRRGPVEQTVSPRRSPPVPSISCAPPASAAQTIDASSQRIAVAAKREQRAQPVATFVGPAPTSEEVVSFISSDLLSPVLRDRLGPGQFAQERINDILTLRGTHAAVFQFRDPGGRPSRVLRLPQNRIMSDEEVTRYRLLSEFVGSQTWDLGIPAIALVDSCFQTRTPVPGVVMDYAKGDALDDVVDDNFTNRAVMESLAASVSSRIMRLQSVGFAHGDLSHDNIMVGLAGGTPRLCFVDFDDIYLDGAPVGETVGHPNYQHPGRRAEDWASTMDSFSAFLIWTALSAIAADPAIYERHGGDGALLFEDADLWAPSETPIWNQLKRSPEGSVRSATETLEQLLNQPRPPRSTLIELMPSFSA